MIKVLICRTKLQGYHRYSCPKCDYEAEVPHSCKSRFCSVCGTISNEEWIKDRTAYLLDCPYYHVVITVPFGFYWIIKRLRVEMLNTMIRLAAEVIQHWAKERGYTVGIVAFYHSFGSNLQFHPHWHLIVTRGGVTSTGQWVTERSNLPGHILMPRFRAKFCQAVKEVLTSGKIQLKAPLSKYLYFVNEAYKQHWQFYSEAVTTTALQTMKYIMRYVKRMILAEKRIVDFNDKEVSFFNKDKKLLIYKIHQFIKCVVQHIPEHQFKQIRYYGLYSPRCKKQYEQAKRYWQPISRRLARLTWRMRQWKRLGHDPLICPHCKIELTLTLVKLPHHWAQITMDQIKTSLNLAVQLPLQLEYG